jgi:hypothetical protein
MENRAMPTYEDILQSVNAQGIQSYSQGSQARNLGVEINSGVCRGLVVLWLKAKAAVGPSRFWDGHGVTKDVENQLSLLSNAVDVQREYANSMAVLATRTGLRDGVATWVADPATNAALLEAGMKFEPNQVLANAQWGFASVSPNPNPQNIVQRMLADTARFAVLGIWGDAGGHSIGIHRPHEAFGKSKSLFVFDPNIGEFKVDGAADAIALLTSINRLGYERSQPALDLNKQFMLWTYSKKFL